MRRWVAALRSSADPRMQEVNVLVRPHPYNCRAWDPDPVADLRGVAVFPRRGYNPIDADNRADFYDSSHHSAAVVGINTSAMIEAAIIGRPVFSLLADEFADTQEGTIHFHHLLPENGGCVRIASTLEEHVRQLSERLRDPEGARTETERFIAGFIRPHGVRLEFPIFSLNPGLRPRGVAPDVWPTLPVRCPPCGRRRAPRSPTSGPITGERDRFGPLAPPVAVWAAFRGRFADVAAAAGSRAVGRRWAWRCAGLVRQA